MSRVIVIGGSGRTGSLLVDQLLAQGDRPVATIRDSKKMASLVRRAAETVMIDLEKTPLNEIAMVMTGADAVVFAAGSATGESSAIDRKGVMRTLKAAEKAGVRRYVAISALGDSTPVPGEWVKTPEMKDYYKQKRAASKAIHASKLDWTIIEPGELTDGKLTGKVKLSTDGLDNETAISRADLAAVTLAALATRGSIGKTFQIIGGKSDIGEAVRKASGGDAKAEPETKKGAAKATAKKSDAKKSPAKKTVGKKAPGKAPAKKAAAKKPGKKT
ncbi:MAG: NAD(P)-binding oxidoreductase [Devosia sp.]